MFSIICGLVLLGSTIFSGRARWREAAQFALGGFFAGALFENGLNDLKWQPSSWWGISGLALGLMFMLIYYYVRKWKKDAEWR